MFANLKLDQWKSLLRTGSAYIAGGLSTLGFVSIAQRDGLIATVTKILDGVGEIVTGLSIIVPPVAALVVGAWGVLKSSTKAQVQSVDAAAPKDLVDAVANVKPTMLIAAVDAMPAVAGVVTKPTQVGHALAASIPSPTVVAAGTDRAAAVAGK